MLGHVDTILARAGCYCVLIVEYMVLGIGSLKCLVTSIYAHGSVWVRLVPKWLRDMLLVIK